MEFRGKTGTALGRVFLVLLVTRGQSSRSSFPLDQQRKLPPCWILRPQACPSYQVLEGPRGVCGERRWKSCPVFTCCPLCRRACLGSGPGWGSTHTLTGESACHEGDLAPAPAPGSGRAPGGHGSPLQYSCWRTPGTEATVHRVTKGWTPLSTKPAPLHTLQLPHPSSPGLRPAPRAASEGRGLVPSCSCPELPSSFATGHSYRRLQPFYRHLSEWGGVRYSQQWQQHRSLQRTQTAGQPRGTA